MAGHYNISPDGAWFGKQRTLEDFQFDLETALTMSRLAVWKPREERDATTLMVEILQSTAGKKDCSRSFGDACRGLMSKQWVESVVRSAGSKHGLTCKSNCARGHWHMKWCVGLGQIAREGEVWYERTSDVFQ